jgi:hypothetical protein
MSQEDVDRYLEGAEAFNRGDMKSGTEGFAADAVFVPQAAVMEGDFTGPDGVRTFLTGLTDLYEVGGDGDILSSSLGSHRGLMPEA